MIGLTVAQEIAADVAKQADVLHDGMLLEFLRDMGVAIVVIGLVWVGTEAWQWWQARRHQ